MTMSDPGSTVPAAVERAVEIMGQHSIDPTRTDVDRNDYCVCGGWISDVMSEGWDDHLAEALAEAGLLVAPTVAVPAGTGGEWVVDNTSVEWAVRSTGRNGFVATGATESEATVREWCRAIPLENPNIVSSVPVRRTVQYRQTAWQEVDSEGTS